MADWATFVGITGVVLALLLVLSHLTQSAFDDGSEPDRARDSSEGADPSVTAEPNAELDSSTHTDPTDPRSSIGIDDSVATGRDGTLERNSNPSLDPETDERADTVTADSEHRSRPETERPADRSDEIDPRSLSTGELLANVALSQGLFALVLLGAAIYTGIPADALGIEFTTGYLEQGLLLGTAFGLLLYVANEIGAAAATRFGFDHDEELRELLAPDSARGWSALLLVVLPIIAVFEELLFRAALIGVVAAGFSISPWLLAVVSSIAFAVGHGMQGSVGVVVTGLLGFVLAAIFILTGSFLAVVVAHYLVNALEFVVHEGLGFEWARTLES
ncbi:CPBP family intramembrane glutamic endopeptidase [Natronorubrum texcoconense]|uniref:Membrane protease YdiL, CAAX protease family n=1 Tax=Natronorubrum texcoconense TaxID=1095776 RepID=A0A1G8Y176_9EURY|nr:type II CAAX endopeptidase family protein [Natronorubrum texcoconense]SDJ96541.1 Membrane protease YdiL, CAAX protease family [Natronorubrum texcoconense]